jgi:hypothetical protein
MLITKLKNRMSAQHLDPKILDGIGIRERVVADLATLIPGDRRQMVKTLVLLKLRVVDVHHDHARQTPHDHQRADSDAEIAMKPEKLPDHVSVFAICYYVLPSLKPCTRAGGSKGERVIGGEGSRQTEMMGDIRIACRVIGAGTERRVVGFIEDVIQMQIDTLMPRLV